jgi:hypothetical protein
MSLSTNPPPPPAPQLPNNPTNQNPNQRTNPQLRARGIKILDQLDCFGVKVFTAAALALLLLTVVFIGLSQARMIPPMVPLYIFSGFVVSLGFLCAIHSCQEKVGARHGIPLDAYYEARQPMPPPKIKKRPKNT